MACMQHPATITFLCMPTEYIVTMTLLVQKMYLMLDPSNRTWFSMHLSSLDSLDLKTGSERLSGLHTRLLA